MTDAKKSGEQKPVNNTQTTAITKPVDFDSLSADKQIELLTKVAEDKKPTVDASLLMETLRKNDIETMPSEELIGSALLARREIAAGAVAVIKAGTIIKQTYDLAAKTYEPKAARKVTAVLIFGNVKLPEKYDRMIRRALPEEAKESSHTTEAAKEAQKKPKTEEEKEGLTEIYCPPAICQAIAKYGNENQPCVIYVKGKKVVKVKAGVKVEEAPAKK